MTQADRDRLVALKKKLITQREAAEELGVSVRHVKRLIHALKKRGDKAVVHGLRGRVANSDATPPSRVRWGSRWRFPSAPKPLSFRLSTRIQRKRHKHLQEALLTCHQKVTVVEGDSYRVRQTTRHG